MLKQSVENREPLVRLMKAGVKRDGRWLIRSIDLSVHKGEIVTLIGPNGSGKTTTARLAIGLIKPQQGTVIRQPGLSIGYVPQSLRIDSTLPMTATRLLNLTARHTQSAITQALKSTGVEHLANAQVNRFSGGELQRVLLARALISRPDLLVLDEPVNGVDFSGELELYDLIDRIRRDTGCGVLMISHDLHVVMAGTDTVVCLNGHVCCTGSPETVASSPEYARLFGKRALEALAIYRHDHDHVHMPDGSVCQNMSGCGGPPTHQEDHPLSSANPGKDHV